MTELIWEMSACSKPETNIGPVGSFEIAGRAVSVFHLMTFPHILIQNPVQSDVFWRRR